MLGSRSPRSVIGALALLLVLPGNAAAAPSWLASNVLSPTLGPGGPRLAMSPLGTTLVAWPDTAGGKPVMRVAVREPGDTFAAATLQAPVTTEMSYQASVAISPKGTGIVAWSQKDEAGK